MNTYLVGGAVRDALLGYPENRGVFTDRTLAWIERCGQKARVAGARLIALTAELEKLEATAEAQRAKVEDVERNILHLAQVYWAVAKGREAKEVIEAVRRYVLEEESDLNELELGLREERERRRTAAAEDEDATDTLSPATCGCA